MNDAAYRKRLSADLPKWREAGWVTADGVGAIPASLGPGRRNSFGVATILGTLGALLLGVGVIAFVAANWEEMPRLFRLSAIVLAMAAAYGAAFALDRNGLRVFSEAAALTAGLVFAGAIALVGQTYHMAGDFEGALLVFEIGILTAALLTGSPVMTVLGVVGAGYWTWIGTVDNEVVPHWLSLIAILVGVVAATLQNSHYGRIVAVVGLMFWIAVTIAGFGTADDLSFAAGMMLYTGSALAIWSFGAALATFNDLPRLDALGEAILGPGLFTILVAFGVLQLVETPSSDEGTATIVAAVLAGTAVAFALVAWLRKGLAPIDIIAIAVLALGGVAFGLAVPDEVFVSRVAGGALIVIAALWAVSLGQSGKHPIGKLLGLVAFGLEVIYLYVRTLGTMLDTAVAFLVGGVLFIGLAFILYRIDRVLEARAAADAPAVIPPAASPGGAA